MILLQAHASIFLMEQRFLIYLHPIFRYKINIKIVCKLNFNKFSKKIY